MGIFSKLPCYSEVFAQSPKKSRKEKKEQKDELSTPLEELSPIARPLAQKKLLKKLHKVVKKGLLIMRLILDWCAHILSVRIKGTTSQTRCEGGRERYPQG